MDPRFHLVYQGDRVIDLSDVPHLLEVSLVQKAGSQAHLGEYCVHMEPKTSVADNTVCYIHDGKKQLLVDSCVVFQPGERIGTSLGP